MKKIVVMSIAFVFLLSIVAVGYSHDDDAVDSKIVKAADKLDKVEDRKDKVKDVENKVKTRLEDAREKVKDKISDEKKVENLKEHELKVIEGINRGFKDRLDKLDQGKIERLAKLPPGIAKRIVENADLGQRLEKWTVKNVSRAELKNAFERRGITAEKLKETEIKLKSAKEKFESAKKEFKSKKDDFKKSKSIEDAKAYLLNVIEAITEKLNKLKERIGGSKDISENKTTELLTEIDNRIAKLAELKTKVNVASTKEELKNLTKEVKAGWRHLEHVIKVHGWRVALEHFGGILKQTYHLDNKLNRWLTFAEKKNVTIADKDARVADFGSKMADAKKHYEMAIDEFKKLKDLVQTKENVTDTETTARKALVDSTQTHMREAKKALRSARDVLVVLVKDIVKAFGETDIKTDDGKAVAPTEQTILDPVQTVEGVDMDIGGSVEVVEEETVEL